MKIFKGKNAWWFYLVFVVFNLMPVLAFFNNNFKFSTTNLIIFVTYYLFNLIFLPIIVRNKIELYNDYFVFYYGFGKTKVKISDIKK